MIKMGLIKTFDSIVVATLWMQKQVISFDLDEDGSPDQELDVVIHFNEDKESEEKEITLVDVGGDITVGQNRGEHVDHLEELSTAIDDWFKSMLPDETQIVRNNLARQVFGKVEDHIAEQGMEWAT